MKHKLAMIILALAVLTLGMVLGRWWQPAVDMGSSSSINKERKVLYWKAPMDPNYRRNAPGKSPMGMELVPVYADEGATAEVGVVSISPAMVNNLGVRTVEVEKGALSRRVDTVGYLAYDESTLYQVNTRVDGWIHELKVHSEGAPVKRGQVLFTLYSPALVNAQNEYLLTLAGRNSSLQEASRRRLDALGLTAGQIKRLTTTRETMKRVPVAARADGVVTHLGVREGMYVMPSTQIMAIANPDRLWVLAEVFERQAAWVQHGQRAEIALDYLPGRLLDSVVDYLYPELDPVTRTLKVRLPVDNPDDVLRPNMFARVTLFAADSPPVIHAPRQALIRGEQENRVVLALGDGKFQSRTVQTGMESGERIEIISGLAVGDRIVVSGQFLIDSESNTEVALERLMSTDSGAANAGDQSDVTGEQPGAHDHNGMQSSTAPRVDMQEDTSAPTGHDHQNMPMNSLPPDQREAGQESGE